MGCSMLLAYPPKLLSILREGTARTESKLSRSNNVSSNLKPEKGWFVSLFHFLFIWFVFENTNVGIKYDAFIVVSALDLNHMLNRKSRKNIQGI